MFNGYLTDRVFPKPWKKARLILLNKGKESADYRCESSQTIELAKLSGRGYADDISILVWGNKEQEISEEANDILRNIEDWLWSHRLDLAAEKTEVCVLRGRRKREGIRIGIKGKRIIPVKRVNYLGIIFDDQGIFGPHVRCVAEKAARRSSALFRLMPRIEGPSSIKRRVIYNVVASTILYGAEIWHEAMRVAEYKTLEKIQRRTLLGVVGAYRTAPTEALQVLADVPPIDLMVSERGGCSKAAI
ncbi:hypothetical protein NQ318_016484 [Aromia moschata]|uniref:Reverse transcriptase domain-containing protein n=1 Tax=Aromia moschata TaxID=1265417 RepID=A0AAV8XCG1_9CUCU|nr:hypothetical protein NQ318_016484 [Aromia moschata]